MTALDATNRSNRSNQHWASCAERSSKGAGTVRVPSGYGQGTVRVQPGDDKGTRVHEPASQIRQYLSLRLKIGLSGSRATRLKSNLMLNRQGESPGRIACNVRNRN